MNTVTKSTLLLIILCLVFGAIGVSGIAQTQDSAQKTTVVVRAQSKDAKFIGSSMGGALITVTDAATGKVLASGHTTGSTGDTELLMRTPGKRHQQLSTPGAAKFEAILNLSEPLFVTVSATAPMTQKQAQSTSSTQLWLIPGKDITGDGIILEIPGFAVDVLQPRAHQSMNAGDIKIQANVVMMCGCPTSDGGLWDSSEYEIRAVVKKGGETVGNVPLKFSGQTSLFEGTFSAREGGAYEITVYAWHDKTGNTGVDKTSVVVSR